MGRRCLEGCTCRRHDPEVRKRISESLAGQKHSEERRRRNSESRRGKKRPPEVGLAISKGQKGRGDVRSSEGKKRHAEAMSRHYSDPEYQLKRSLIVSQRIEESGSHLEWFDVQNVLGEIVKCQGNWERKFAEFCLSEEILCSRFDRRGVVRYEWGNRPHHYGPDFYLPEFDIYVEVKGQMSPKEEVKQKAFRESGRKLVVLGWDELRYEPKRDRILELIKL